MKKVLYISLVLAVALTIWLCLNKQARQKPPTSPDPLNAIKPQPPQPETSSVETVSNVFRVGNASNLTNAIESTVPLTNALMAINIEQWKAAIKGLHKLPGLSESWHMEETSQTSYIPVILEKNNQTISYQARFVDISIKNENGDILEAQLRSPIMDIDETRKLGLQLCNMLGQDPADFLAWCDKVGNHWLDTPLFSMGDHYYGFETFHTYNNEKPWSINFLIMRP